MKLAKLEQAKLFKFTVVEQLLVWRNVDIVAPPPLALLAIPYHLLRFFYLSWCRFLAWCSSAAPPTTAASADTDTSCDASGFQPPPCTVCT